MQERSAIYTESAVRALNMIDAVFLFGELRDETQDVSVIRTASHFDMRAKRVKSARYGPYMEVVNVHHALDKSNAFFEGRF